MKVCSQTVTIVGVLNACASILELEEGRYIHEQIIQSSCKSISFVGIAWLTCIQNVGAWMMRVECSTRCHYTMWSPGPPWYWDMWNVGEGRRNWNYFRERQQEGVQPDSVTFVGVLNACACVLALEEGRCAHEQIIQSGCESISFVGNSLIEMYAKCWSMEDAWRFVQQDAITGFGLFKCHSWRMCHAWAW